MLCRSSGMEEGDYIAVMIYRLLRVLALRETLIS